MIVAPNIAARSALSPPPVHCIANDNGGWDCYFQGEQLPVAVRTLEQAKAEKLAAVAEYRYGIETSGITVSGLQIKTDRESQAMINAAWSASQIIPPIEINWKGVDGWALIDAAQISTIAQAVITHVQACFTNERTHAEAVTALPDIAAVDAYDFSTGWPA
jgi:hypothetical protein